MTHIRIKKGLDIPLKGHPIQRNSISEKEISPLSDAVQVGLDCTTFEDCKFQLLVKPGDAIAIGEPLAEDKTCPGRMLTSPAGGIVKEIRRGAKRALKDIIVEIAKEEEFKNFKKIDPFKETRSVLVQYFLEAGIFFNIRKRPFNLLADPQQIPQSIFVKAIESAPFQPPSELQIKGYEKEFQLGLSVLSRLTNGPVHLIYKKGSSLKAFTEAKDVEKHTAEGPHPVGTFSVLIQHLDRIKSPADNIWTLTAHDVLAMGYLLLHGRLFVERIISIAGPGILPDKVGFFKARLGYPIEQLLQGRVQKGEVRFISGDPLMGIRVNRDDFLGVNHFVFSALPENNHREFMHFFGLGLNKYSASKAYLAGHLSKTEKEYDFTTNQHGEARPFIDSALYDKVQPLEISTMLLVKSVLAEDYELAEAYGLLEVDSEDFALATFVCPSKMEMTEIIKKGIRQYAKEIIQ